MGHGEWLFWIAFHGLYDLPDCFLVAGKLGELVAQVAGNRQARAVDFAPYYTPPQRFHRNESLAAAFAFIAQNRDLIERQRQ